MRLLGAARSGAARLLTVGTVAFVPVTLAATARAAVPPETVIDSGPDALLNVKSASFTFHASAPGATFTCALDTGRPGRCSSPKTYPSVSKGTHTFSVAATTVDGTDATPATFTWTVDTTAPTAPTAVSAVQATPTSATVTWAPSTDNTGVTGYDVLRDGNQLGYVEAATSYADAGLTPGTPYRYTVRAHDGAGNVSAPSTAALVITRAPYDPRLTRAPYLTDLVQRHVAINFATDQSATSAEVRYGSVGTDGSCTPDTAVTPARITVQVGTVAQYQWTAQVDLPRHGRYCYRVFLAGADLLGANPSPRFTTQEPVGSTAPFSFAVFGDWGAVDASGSNPDQAHLLAQVAASGARFAVTIGDNGYPSGSQINYGDLHQTGSGTSGVFGPDFWTVPGATTPIFTAVGNHGLAGVAHTDITTWTQARTVATSGGRYQNDVYCCVNGTTSSNYGSEWYAFDAGNARFYVLDSAWGDTNRGTATPYANDALAHFAPGAPEYEWLKNDLQTHSPQLKFAFSHYPFYSDNNTEPSDPYLQGAANLEGLLGSNGVQFVFNGHAHIYERNVASAAGMPVTYVTGGGGATLEPMGICHAYDAYAIGWSYSSNKGSRCGAAKAPLSKANVFHFLKITVNGTSVTIAPTDSLGNTFDVQTYNLALAPDTYLDSAPPAGVASSSATFAFHASANAAVFTCQLDGGLPTPCASPMTYAGLADGAHTFSVAATVGTLTDATPATAAWTADTSAPAAPTGLAASTPSPFEVGLTWTVPADNTGVTGYRIYRDGVLYGSVTSPQFSDAVLGGSTHDYAVSALDIAGNESAPSTTRSVTTAAPPTPVFADGFESGTLSAWSSSGGLAVQGTDVHSGSFAAEGDTTVGATYAKKTLAGTYDDAYARVAFAVKSQVSQINLLRMRTASGTSLGYLYLDPAGRLGFHNDTLNTNTLSALTPGSGWHVAELRLDVATGSVGVWLDNAAVTDLTAATGLGATPVGAFQIGETQTGRTYDVVFDDAAFGSERLGVQ